MFGHHVNRDYVETHRGSARPSITAHIKAAKQDIKHRTNYIMQAVSIFVGGPKNRVITLGEEERSELRDYLRETNTICIAHSAYSAYPWKGDPSAAEYIRKELDVCSQTNISGLVVHLPKAPLETVIKYVPRLITEHDTILYFETPALKDSPYSTPEALNELYAASLVAGLNNVGICFDTAHLWTCGVNIASREDCDAWLSRLRIPFNRLMVHLNDSQRELGVGPDTHAGLTIGKMWEPYADNVAASGIASVVNYAAEHDLPVILERGAHELLPRDYNIIQKLLLQR